MKVHGIAATDTSQSFEINETFFSTTDARGVITSGNEVFCRTSAYHLEELVGQPHNLIRHPGMPRQVFKRLWATVSEGTTFMGYVKNQAKNGNFYWVFAVIVPVPTGYLSVRIKPTSDLLVVIEQLYAAMASAEAQAIARGASETQASEASRAILDRAVEERGFASYAAFSHHALNLEIKHRDAEVKRRALRLFPAAIGEEASRDLKDLYQQTLLMYEMINGLFGSLDAFVELCSDIQQRKDAVQTVAEDFRLNALNAHIAAHPLGFEGITLGTVAQLLNGHGQTLSTHVGVLAQSIAPVTAAVADITSNLSAVRIQVEMLLSFMAEIASANSRFEAKKRQSMTNDLRAGFSASLDQAARALVVVRKGLPAVLAMKAEIRKDIIYLQVTQITGLVEVSRIKHAEGLHATFTGLRDQVNRGKEELEALDVIVDRLNALMESTPAAVQEIKHSAASLREVEFADQVETRLLASGPVMAASGEATARSLRV